MSHVESELNEITNSGQFEDYKLFIKGRDNNNRIHEIMKYGMATLSPVLYVSMFVSQSYLCNQ